LSLASIRAAALDLRRIASSMPPPGRLRKGGRLAGQRGRIAVLAAPRLAGGREVPGRAILVKTSEPPAVTVEA
jgi:hypothetical protein